VNRTRVLGGAGAVLIAALLVPFGPTTQAGARSTRADAVLLKVDSVTPSTPQPTSGEQPLIIDLTITNTTSTDYTGVQILGERGDPIGNLTQLSASLANPVPPTSGLPVPAHPVVTRDLPAQTTISVEFDTSTSLQDNGRGICLCHYAVYPLFFSAHAVIDGVDNRLGVTATYLPVFYDSKPQPVRVTWVWPLLDRPHRLLSDTVFTDDQLATSLSTGRLSRALEVVEQVGDHVPLTLVVDPELLDEIEVMASEPYTVQQGNRKATPGTGQDAATAWLGRLRNVLLNDPTVTVRLTPYADPDVETLTERKFRWSSALPPDMAARVTEALAGRPLDTSFSWPVTGAVSLATLHRLYEQDVRTVLLNASGVALNTERGAVPAGLVNLEADRRGHQVVAALLYGALQRQVAAAIDNGGEGSAALPGVMAELAIRAVQQPDHEHTVTIAAPRYVDPDVGAAVHTIEETTGAPFAEPLALPAAVSDSGLISTQLGRLAKVPSSVLADLPPTLVDLASVRQGAHVIRSLLDTQDDAAAATLVDTLPIAMQRAESSAWRAPVNVDAATSYAQALSSQIETLRSGVHLVQPSGGTYTLAATDSPLPITVTNTLRYAVNVRIKIVVTSGINPKPVGVVPIEANQTKTINVPATTDRPGLIKIEVVLQAPNSLPLGVAVTMTVRSTALGFVGVIITVVAGVVLGIALLWRLFRRLRGRGAPGRPARGRKVSTPEPVG
jgi:hypothetical protein